MSRNGSGVYSLAAGNPVTTGTTISSTWANNTLTDIASALTASIASDGQTVITANLPMSTYAHTGVGVATARTMYGTAGQIQDNTLTYLTTIAGTNVITAVAPVLMSAYATGQTFYFLAAGGNTGAVTVNINAIGAKDIKRTDGSALVSGDILTGAAVQIMYDGTNFQLLSDSNGTNETVGNLTVTGTTTATGLITANGGVSGALNGTLGATTPSTVVATDLTTTGNTILGNASTDTLNVGNGNLVTDASGNVGVGIASPTTKLDVVSSASASSYQTVMRLKTTNTGDVHPSLLFEDFRNSNTNTASINSDCGATVGTSTLVYNSDTVHRWLTASVERMRIDASGNLLVGKTASAGHSVGVNVQPNGFIIAEGTTAALTDTFNYYNTTAAAYRFYVDNGGTIHATSIVITAISDERLKENIRDIDTGLNAIMALKPRRFDWKVGKGQDKKNAAGFIAQEFEQVFPECVSTSKAGEDAIEYKNINHETLIPSLVKAIQELNAKFEEYKASHP